MKRIELKLPRKIFEEKDKELTLTKQTLREDYFRVAQFFWYVSTAKYDYKIILSRRCLVLFKFYLNIFSKYKHFNPNGFISDKSIYDYSKLKGKSILVVDDILIHGRAITNCIDKIEKANPKLVETIVFFASEESLDNDKLKFDYIYSDVKENMFRLSNNIVYTIFNLGLSYTSFVPTIYFDKTSNEKLDGFHEITSAIQNKYGFRSFVKSIIVDEFILLNKIASKICLRAYKSNLNKSFYIPYVVLKDFYVDDFNKLSDELSNYLPIECKKIRGILSQKENLNSTIFYKARLLTFILSYLIFKKIYGGLDKFTVDKEMVDLNFTNGVLKEIEAINDGFLDIKLSISCDELSCVDSDATKNQSFENLISSRFWDDELEARSGKARKGGFSISSISSDNIENFISFIDSGKATSDFEIHNYSGRDVLLNAVAPGEQAYRIVIEKYAKQIYELFYLRNSIEFYEINNANEVELEYLNQTLSEDVDIALKEIKTMECEISSIASIGLFDDIPLEQKLLIRQNIDKFLDKKLDT